MMRDFLMTSVTGVTHLLRVEQCFKFLVFNEASYQHTSLWQDMAGDKLNSNKCQALMILTRLDLTVWAEIEVL